jgi:hypothetical protein
MLLLTSKGPSMPALDHLLGYWGASRSDIATAIDATQSSLRHPSDAEEAAIEALDRFLLSLYQAGVDEPATFMSVPLVDGYTAVGWRIYAEGGADLLRRLASRELSAEEMIGHFDPDWRRTYWTSFKTVQAADGGLSVMGKSYDDVCQQIGTVDA